MNRIGVSVEDAVEFINEVRNADYLEFGGVFTHLANAEIREKHKFKLTDGIRLFHK